KEIVAFANTNGGKVYIGVEDNGKVVGVSNAKDAQITISHMIRDGIRPDLTMHTSVRVEQLEGKEVVVVDVSKGTKRPYHLSHKGMKSSGVYMRHGTSANPVSEAVIRQMIIESDGTTYERLRSLNQELTFSYAEHVFLTAGIQFEQSQFRTLGIINEDQYFTNLGLLLSDQCEHSMKCAAYEGESKLAFRDRKVFHGSILKQLDDAFAYIGLYNKMSTEFQGLNRVERTAYPTYAIREALINAVVHRDYSFSGSILIHIFENRMEFVSVGGLVNGLSFNDILLGVSESRNKKLASCFYRLKLIESYGTGIGRIQECYRNMRRQPEFKVSPNAFLVLLYNTLATERLESPEEKTIGHIRQHGQASRKEIEELLGLSKTTVTKIINDLLHQQKLSSHGTGRSTVYRLP
ncbi:MAG: RNA-binding domain-containing protein, partial [Bacilli bacterium]